MTDHAWSRSSDVPRVLIAGGASGTGLACAEALAERGVELILCDLNAQALCRAAGRLQLFARFCDAVADHSVAIFAAEVAERFDSVDVLINAAGNGYVRTLAMMCMTRAVLPLLRRTRGRRLIVNVAPSRWIAADDGLFPYAGSRAAFEQLSKAIADRTRGTSIRVVNVAPAGPVTVGTGFRPSASHSDASRTATQIVGLIERELGSRLHRHAERRRRSINL